MSPTLHLLLFATTIATVSLTTQKADKPPGCQEFAKGATFTEAQAIGNWHMLHQGTEKSGNKETHCIQFSLATDQERKDVSNRISQFVKNLKWESLTLKMQIPLSSLKSNKTRDYYLEKLEGQGSSRSLQMPIPGADLHTAELDLHPIQLKIVEDQYLGMMDCHGKFMFLFGKELHKGQKMDGRLKKMIEAYWPQERK